MGQSLLAFPTTAGALALLLLPPAITSADERAPAAAAAEGLSAKEWKKLGKGDVVVRGTIEATGSGASGAGIGFVLIDAPWLDVFGVLASHETTPDYVKCAESASVLARWRDGPVERVKVAETHETAGITMRYTLSYVHDPARREITWTLDRGADNDMTENAGSWRLVPLDGGRTLAVYRLAGETDTWIPKFLERYFLKTGMKRMLVAVDKRVESGGTWTKDD